jgi:hypothetical protein
MQQTGKLWSLWSGGRFKLVMEKGYYNELLKYYQGQTSVATGDIEKDLHRSFPNHPFYQTPAGIETLRRVLIAYSWRNQQIGYTQSMSIICSVLLVNMSEEDAFWVMASICEDLLPGFSFLFFFLFFCFFLTFVFD